MSFLLSGQYDQLPTPGIHTYRGGHLDEPRSLLTTLSSLSF